MNSSYHDWYREAIELFDAHDLPVERQKFEEEYVGSWWHPKKSSFLTEGTEPNPFFDPNNPVFDKWTYPATRSFKEPLLKQCNALSRLRSTSSVSLSSELDPVPNSQNASAKGRGLELEVAAIYRALGAQVEHNVSLAGNQIDLLVTESTLSGSTMRLAIECKAYARPVGIDVINSFAAISRLLKDRGTVNRALLVSSHGFTVQARSAAEEHGIDLLELRDLQQRVRGRESEVRKAEMQVGSEHRGVTASGEQEKKLFPLMPFSKELDDAYILGIREVAEKLDLVVERADSIEHNEQILSVIQEKIRACDIVVADTTYHNANVFYEIGYSHAQEKPTVLVTRAGQPIPFDLRAMNHIFYETVVDLREKLGTRLTHMLK